jgi:hypothetical protein
MKTLVSVLAESPFYFTMSPRDRYGLVKRLAARQQEIDLSRYQAMVEEFLKAPSTNLSKSPRFYVSYGPKLDDS